MVNILVICKSRVSSESCNLMLLFIIFHEPNELSFHYRKSPLTIIRNHWALNLFYSNKALILKEVLYMLGFLKFTILGCLSVVLLVKFQDELVVVSSLHRCFFQLLISSSLFLSGINLFIANIQTDDRFWGKGKVDPLW